MQTPLIDPVISIEKLKALRERSDLVILDCRGSLTTPGAGKLLFDAGHIPGASYIDMAQDITGKRTGTNGRTPMVDAATFAQTLRRLGTNTASTVVVYDTGLMNFAPRVWFTVRATGLVNAFVLDGGFDAWQKSSCPLETVEVPKTPGNFTAAASSERIFSTEEIEQNLLTHRYLLLDARIEDVYLGIGAGPDAKTGHIPGSVNHPNRLNVGTDGLLLDAGTLELRRAETCLRCAMRDLRVPAFTSEVFPLGSATRRTRSAPKTKVKSVLSQTGKVTFFRAFFQRKPY